MAIETEAPKPGEAEEVARPQWSAACVLGWTTSFLPTLLLPIFFSIMYSNYVYLRNRAIAIYNSPAEQLARQRFFPFLQKPLNVPSIFEMPISGLGPYTFKQSENLVLTRYIDGRPIVEDYSTTEYLWQPYLLWILWVVLTFVCITPILGYHVRRVAENYRRSYTHWVSICLILISAIAGILSGAIYTEPGHFICALIFFFIIVIYQFLQVATLALACRSHGLDLDILRWTVVTWFSLTAMLGTAFFIAWVFPGSRRMWFQWAGVTLILAYFLGWPASYYLRTLDDAAAARESDANVAPNGSGADGETPDRDDDASAKKTEGGVDV